MVLKKNNNWDSHNLPFSIAAELHVKQTFFDEICVQEIKF